MVRLSQKPLRLPWQLISLMKIKDTKETVDSPGEASWAQRNAIKADAGILVVPDVTLTRADPAIELTATSGGKIAICMQECACAYACVCVCVWKERGWIKQVVSESHTEQVLSVCVCKASSKLCTKEYSAHPSLTVWGCTCECAKWRPWVGTEGHEMDNGRSLKAKSSPLMTQTDAYNYYNH